MNAQLLLQYRRTPQHLGHSFSGQYRTHEGIEILYDYAVINIPNATLRVFVYYGQKGLKCLKENLETTAI